MFRIRPPFAYTGTVTTLMVIIVLFVGCVLAMVAQGEERKQLRHTAYQEGIGEEYDLELNRQLELRSLRPQDAPSGPDPYRHALEIARLQKRTTVKSVPSKEVSSQPDQRRPGLLKSSLGFITASLAAAKELIPLVHDLHENSRLQASLTGDREEQFWARNLGL